MAYMAQTMINDSVLTPVLGNKCEYEYNRNKQTHTHARTYGEHIQRIIKAICLFAFSL